MDIMQGFTVLAQATAKKCPGGEIGRRRGLKIPRRKACRFDSGPGHHNKIKHLQCFSTPKYKSVPGLFRHVFRV